MRDELRILQVNYADTGGGAEGSSYNLFKEYARRGVDSWLAVGHKTRADDRILQIPNQLHRPVWNRLCRTAQARLKSEKYDRTARLIGMLAWLAEPKRYADRNLGIDDHNHPGTWKLPSLPPRRPTVLHCHNLHGGYFDLRALPWLSRQLPVILNLRDAWLLSGHCAHSLGCDRWRYGCGKCPDLTIVPAIPRDATAHNWKVKKEIYDRSLLYVTAPSQWMIDQQRRSMLQGVQSVVIPNAIDTSIFAPGSRAEARRNLNIQSDEQVILITAHNYFKDLQTMEAAVARIQPSQAGRVVCYCLGPRAPERRLGAAVIRYVGFEPDPVRLAMYYSASDVYFHASFGESFCKTVVEAMACGTPVVAGAVGGIPELITHGVTGFLATPKEPAEMAQYIERLLRDEALRREIGANASAYARSRFKLSMQGDRFLEWYAEIMEDWNVRRQSVPLASAEDYN